MDNRKTAPMTENRGPRGPILDSQGLSPAAKIFLSDFSGFRGNAEKKEKKEINFPRFSTYFPQPEPTSQQTAEIRIGRSALSETPQSRAAANSIPKEPPQ